MIISDLPLAQAIIQYFKKLDVKHIVISPGSRNAPLTISFANDPFFNCFSITDERSAAFFGLGMAQQLQKPVAMVCTSGSALLNYYPAIAEAFYSQIPIIVLSADRPIDKIDIGDGQTIRQDNVFANHILFSKTLNEKDNVENDEAIYKAIETSILKKGPVHLNVPFEEPLYGTTNQILREIEFKTSKTSNHQAFVLSSDFIDAWQNSSKKMILVGDLLPNNLSNTLIEDLLQDESIIFLSEKNSNLHHHKLVDQIDVLLTPFGINDFEILHPDLLLTFGGMIVSKRIKAFLRTYQPKYHFHVDELRAYDTFFCLTKHIQTNPESFINQLLINIKPLNSTYGKIFLKIFEDRKIKAKAFLENQPFCDFKVFEIILKQLPDNIHLQIGNSSPIRYIQLFETKSTWDIYCNRGTSGIDGSTSTAMGAALINQKPTVLITGDLSFFYDNNGLWHNYMKKDFGIILINNGGGGIFRILPGHEENDVFNQFFEIQHQLNASHLAEMHGLVYYKASSEKELINQLQEIFTNHYRHKPFILEVFTPTDLNDKILKNFFEIL